jgi:hypothetical protein
MVLSSMIGDWITEIVSVIIIIMYEFLLKYCWGGGWEIDSFIIFTIEFSVQKIRFLNNNCYNNTFGNIRA